MKVVRIGLDIAKSVFQVHGVDLHGKTVFKKTLTRGEMLTFFANTPVSLIGIEACAGSHYWARELIKLGHDARLMAAQLTPRGPTHHSTGPARKDTQASEFKHWAS